MGRPVTAAGASMAVEPVAGPAHDEQLGVGALRDVLDGDDRVDAAAERDQRADRRGRAPVVRSRWPGRASPRARRSEAGQVQVVAVGELAEAVEVERAQEPALGVGDRVSRRGR